MQKKHSQSHEYCKVNVCLASDLNTPTHFILKRYPILLSLDVVGRWIFVTGIMCVYLDLHLHVRQGVTA